MVPAVTAFLKRTASSPVAPISKDFMLFVVFTSNLCGIVSARSLHYQFYSWQAPWRAWMWSEGGRGTTRGAAGAPT